MVREERRWEEGYRERKGLRNDEEQTGRTNTKHVPYAGAAAAAGLYAYGVPKPVGEEVRRSNSVVHLFHSTLHLPTSLLSL